MRNTDEQIKISSDAICKLIDKFEVDKRGCLSQNILDKLRTFVVQKDRMIVYEINK
jgi:hypothetical protein